ncbi:Hypothetical predicted protein [Cloeon dipterum]|uniref:Microsomal glutathione S-transferase 1 n=1 Tax=Cloeon dipterum TaxID=197152 RepID=A0A8S1CF60_9INSE|nr:Hypothetical predicted protein [Cloeon dipterum]
MSESFEFSRNNELLALYAKNASILVFKIFGVTALTARARFATRKFPSIEDAKALNGSVGTDDKIERRRRAHLNDLENIPSFLCISFLYLLTEPEPEVAKTLFWTYTGARVIHTLVYAVKPVPQPARALSFGVGLGITCYMAGKVLIHFCSPK